MTLTIGTQVRHSDHESDVGTVSARDRAGNVRVTWRQPGFAKPRMRVWYEPLVAARFLKRM